MGEAEVNPPTRARRSFVRMWAVHLRWCHATAAADKSIMTVTITAAGRESENLIQAATARLAKQAGMDRP